MDVCGGFKPVYIEKNWALPEGKKKEAMWCSRVFIWHLVEKKVGFGPGLVKVLMFIV